MIHSELWRCDWCGGSFSTKEKCEECENGHMLVGDIARRCFLTNERYPRDISVEYGDGVTINYTMDEYQDKFKRYIHGDGVTRE